MIYGAKPKDLGMIDISCKEMLFYQYLPIKLLGQETLTVGRRLQHLDLLINTCCSDYMSTHGLSGYACSYVYLTVKHLYQEKGSTFNRKGYHSDGFMTDDINYIWSDCQPTIFNFGEFELSMDDKVSMDEMEQQAQVRNEYSYPNKSLLRLDQYVIHKVSNNHVGGMRTFVKVSFSKDKYDLIGNSKNYLLDYNWDMRERNTSRNIPQNLT